MPGRFTRLRTDRVRILYLTTRDHTVPLESTLRGIQDLHDEGLFDEFGLSNFSVADIEDVLAVTTREGWIPPTVYRVSTTPSPASWKPSTAPAKPSDPNGRPTSSSSKAVSARSATHSAACLK